MHRHSVTFLMLVNVVPYLYLHTLLVILTGNADNLTEGFVVGFGGGLAGGEVEVNSCLSIIKIVAYVCRNA